LATSEVPDVGNWRSGIEMEVNSLTTKFSDACSVLGLSTDLGLDDEDKELLRQLTEIEKTSRRSRRKSQATELIMKAKNDLPTFNQGPSMTVKSRSGEQFYTGPALADVSNRYRFEATPRQVVLKSMGLGDSESDMLDRIAEANRPMSISEVARRSVGL